MLCIFRGITNEQEPNDPHHTVKYVCGNVGGFIRGEMVMFNLVMKGVGFRIH